MCTIARKGLLSVTLLVCLLAAQVAAAAPAERSEGREGAVTAGWVGWVVEWVSGGVLLGGRIDPPSEREYGPRQMSAADGSTGGSNSDPNG